MIHNTPLTSREEIGNNIKQKFISHMRSNGVVIATKDLSKYFAPNGRMIKRNTNPNFGIQYEEDINLQGAFGGDQVPEELTWISECEGNLILSNNNLISLEGCPEVVIGDFFLNKNNMDLLLLGFPKQVGTDRINSNIDLSHTKIVGLKYLPRVTNGSLSLIECYLNSLEDCPQTINGDFEIINNLGITTLQGGPTSVSGVMRCNETAITNFVHAPINPDFGGIVLPENMYLLAHAFRYLESWAGFRPALKDSKTASVIKYIEDQYELVKQSKTVDRTNETVKIIMGLGSYLEIRKSKPELDTSIEAREEYAAYNPSSLEDFKAKTETKEYEGVDINFIKMLKKALLK
jgi:hypothetical protein